MIKITDKTSIININKHIASQILKGNTITDIMKQDNLLHNIYDADRMDLIEDLYNIYGSICLNIQDDYGRNLLHRSIRINKKNTIKFVKMGMRLDVLNNKGYAPIHMIAECYDEETIKEISRVNNINSVINSLSKFKDTPLMIASTVGNIESVRALLRLKPNLSLKNGYGNNCLFIAVMMKHYEIVKLLLQTNYQFSIVNDKKLNIYDIATIVHDLPISNLLANSHLKKVKTIEVEEKYRCTICDMLMIEPITLKCSHRYCMSCFLMSNTNIEEGNPLQCAYRCNIGKCSSDDLSVDKELMEDIKNNHNDSVIDNRLNVYYYSRAYLSLSSLGLVYDNFTTILYKGGLEFNLVYVNKMIKIDVKTNIILPQVHNVSNNIMKMLLESNKAMERIGIGATYIKDDIVHISIDIPTTYLDSELLDKLIDSFITPLQTIVASAHMFANLMPISISLPILQNIDKDLIRKPKMIDILDSLKDIPSGLKILPDNNRSVTVEISNDNCFIELTKIVGKIDTEYYPSYKYILSYNRDIFKELHNGRLSINKITGVISLHSIIIYAMAHSEVIKEQYNLLDKISDILSRAIMINCR